VLETCVKNCGRRFHLQIATKDFMQELIKLIGPKYDPPQALQERVLGLIQIWAEAFKGVSELKEVVRTYQDLKTKGVDFPQPNVESNVAFDIPAEPTSRPAPGSRTISKSVRQQRTKSEDFRLYFSCYNFVKLYVSCV
jgi:hypothetical protein